MIKLLLDANLSPETRVYLANTFHFDVIDLLTEMRGTLRDDEVVALAQRENRVIVTFDRDFGEIYHFREKGRLGVIILRLEDQTVESINRVLDRFFRSQVQTIDLERSLVIVERDRIRIVRG